MKTVYCNVTGMFASELWPIYVPACQIMSNTVIYHRVYFSPDSSLFHVKKFSINFTRSDLITTGRHDCDILFSLLFIIDQSSELL